VNLLNGRISENRQEKKQGTQSKTRFTIVEQADR